MRHQTKNKNKFYTLIQNNVEGYLIQNEDVDEFVIIEAETIEGLYDIADKILEGYYDFCPCCGSRWSYLEIEGEDGEDEPKIFGKPVEQYFDSSLYKTSRAIIYYLDGKKRIYNSKIKTWEDSNEVL